MRGLITETNWEVGSLSPAVDEIIGLAIATDPNGVRILEAPEEQLADPSTLMESGMIGVMAMTLLRQAPLVYPGHHATSINFVQQLLPTLRREESGPLPILKKDLEAYAIVQDRIRTAPFLGCRAQLPAIFQIKSFPRLVFLALKYHKASLTTKSEKATFAAYNITSVADHGPEAQHRTALSQLAAILPPPEVESLSALMAVLNIDQATFIMDRQSPELRTQIYSQLKNVASPGPWALAEMTIRRRRQHVHVYMLTI
jgi:hypothetical protein